MTQAIEQRLNQWTEDFNARRADRICDLFAPNLIAHYQGQPEKSFSSICSSLKTSLVDDTHRFHYKLKINEIIVAGNLAVVRLIWYLTVNDNKNDTTIKSADRGMDVFQLQPDGRWRIIRYLAYVIRSD